MSGKDHDSEGTRRDSILNEVEPIESIEDLLRKCGFFDILVLNEGDNEILPN